METIKKGNGLTQQKYTAEIDSIKSLNDKYQKEIFDLQKKVLKLEKAGNELLKQKNSLQSKISSSNKKDICKQNSFSLNGIIKEALKINAQNSFCINGLTKVALMMNKQNSFEFVYNKKIIK